MGGVIAGNCSSLTEQWWETSTLNRERRCPHTETSQSRSSSQAGTRLLHRCLVQGRAFYLSSYSIQHKNTRLVKKQGNEAPPNFITPQNLTGHNLTSRRTSWQRTQKNDAWSGWRNQWWDKEAEEWLTKMFNELKEDVNKQLNSSINKMRDELKTHEAAEWRTHGSRRRTWMTTLVNS